MNEAVHSEILVLVWRRARTSIECVQENECAIEKLCGELVWREREGRRARERELSARVSERERRG